MLVKLCSWGECHWIAIGYGGWGQLLGFNG